MIFCIFKKIVFLGILGPPYCGIGATIRIGREMLCLPYAEFFCVELNFPVCLIKKLLEKLKKIKLCKEKIPHTGDKASLDQCG